MLLPVAVEQGPAGIVGHEVDLRRREGGQRADVLDQPGRPAAGIADKLEAVPRRVGSQGIDKGAGIMIITW